MYESQRTVQKQIAQLGVAVSRSVEADSSALQLCYDGKSEADTLALTVMGVEP